MNKRKFRTGFTMVELMAILIIISLLAALVIKQVGGKIDQARVTTTKAKLKMIADSVEQFKIDTGRYPTEEESLMALIEKPSDVENWDPEGYLRTTDLPKDGWGRDFIYELSPESGKPYVIISLGADDQEGGEGVDKDLYSTDAN